MRERSAINSPHGIGSSMAIGVVAVAYAIPDARLQGFMSWNIDILQAISARCVIVTSGAEGIEGPYRLMPWPGEAFSSDHPFSLARTSNWGLRQIIDECEVAIKTDVDVVLTRHFIDKARVLPLRVALAPHYRLAETAGEALAGAPNATLWPQSVGTIAAHADDWKAVCGYDERQCGYGVEDGDLYSRMAAAGVYMDRTSQVMHVAHIEGSIQAGRRHDLWNRESINPRNHEHNRRAMQTPWISETWGKCQGRSRMIKVFYHIAPMGDWRSVVKEQGELLQASGLAAAADQINICWAGNREIALQHNVCGMVAPGKAQIKYCSQLDQYEFPALHMLYHGTNAGDVVLYMHTKGVSKTPPHKEGADQWRRFLGWVCIERWRECIAALDEVEMASGQWTNLGGSQYANLCGQQWVWAGNFWWARGEYILRLRQPEVSQNRWLAEGWPVSGNPTIRDLYNLTQGQLVCGLPRPTGPNVPGFGRHSYTKDPPLSLSLGVEADYAREWPMRARFDVINAIIAKRGYRRYLEIGLETGNCFRRIKCKRCESVDPFQSAATHVMPSDAYFAKAIAENVEPWDLIFIDGLHEREQVLRDVDNGLAVLAPNGCLLLHDCQPETPFQARDIPAYDGRGMWTGNVWEAWAKLRMARPDLRMLLVDIDCGCGYIDRQGQSCYPEKEINWRLYWSDRVALMNRISVREFSSFLDTPYVDAKRDS